MYIITLECHYCLLTFEDFNFLRRTCECMYKRYIVEIKTRL